MVLKNNKSFFIKKIWRHGPAGFDRILLLNFLSFSLSHIFLYFGQFFNLVSLPGRRQEIF